VIVKNNDKPYTLLIIEDSFSIRLSSFLNQSFGTIIYLHYFEEESQEFVKLIERFNPDLVIYQMGAQSLFRQHEYTKMDNTVPYETERKMNKLIALEGRNLSERLSGYHQIEKKVITDGELQFTATGEDPFLFFPSLTLPGNEKIAIRITFSVPGETVSQLFYTTEKNRAYNQQQSVSLNAKAGENILTFYLPEMFSGSRPVRFDPGNIPGQYSIRKAEFFSYSESYYLP
jgi:hypothetical protein